MNALVMRLEERADQAAAAGENELAALLWEAAAAVALSPDQPATGVRTGWPAGHGLLERSVMAPAPKREGLRLEVVPCDLKTANDFVRRFHRHSRPVVGHKFAVAVALRHPIGDTVPGGAGYGMHADSIVGVAIVGRPVAPRLDDGKAAEITRLCTDGTRNACSMLYGAARRAARAMGHSPIYTYTLPDEGGASLRAAGFRLDKEDAGGSSSMWHNRPGRKAQPIGDDLVGGKWRWIG